MKLAHFYHVWTGGDFHPALSEHFQALASSGFDGSVHVNLVREGWEQETLGLLWRYAIRHPGQAVLYAHTKGAYSPQDGFAARWRRSMTRHVVLDWKRCLTALEQGYDAVGCHWLTEEEYGDQVEFTVPPFFGGNFWMASTDYLSTLGKCSMATRWHAESWIGLNSPKVLDLLPGWPGDHLWRDLCPVT